jgi:hypothetical protein
VAVNILLRVQGAIFMLRGASVFIMHNKAYVPSSVELAERGAFMSVEPVYVVELNIEELTQALEHVLTVDSPIIPTPTLEEFKSYRDPVLAATGARSGLALRRNSLAYGISLSDDGVLIALPEFDKQGRGRVTPFSPRVQLPATASIRDIAAAILNDADSRLMRPYAK